MGLTYGFYNSVGNDREYNAQQISSIFDGIIKDGIFMSIGEALLVKATTGMTLNVSDGRAWFNQTWTDNDSTLALAVDISEIALNRIDTVVLEVNKSDEIRANSIKIIKGTPATNPVAPTIVKTELVKQYPLSNIYVGAGVTNIIQANITNRVGTVDCPFITGILETLNVSNLLAQWDSIFNTWLSGVKDATTTDIAKMDSDFNIWLTGIKDAFNIDITKMDSDFNTWFNGVKGALSGDIAANLSNRMTVVEASLADTSHVAGKIYAYNNIGGAL